MKAHSHNLQASETIPSFEEIIPIIENVEQKDTTSKEVKAYLARAVSGLKNPSSLRADDRGVQFGHDAWNGSSVNEWLTNSEVVSDAEQAYALLMTLVAHVYVGPSLHQKSLAEAADAALENPDAAETTEATQSTCWAIAFGLPFALDKLEKALKSMDIPAVIV